MRDSIGRSFQLLAFVLAVNVGVGCYVSATEPGTTTIRIATPMPPPDWALLERELLRARSAPAPSSSTDTSTTAGYLECVERWGGDDGPDDAIENVNDWPVLYALGGAESILTRFKKAWEGHLRQYTKARTTEVPFARDGMYYKEFHVMFDWFHHGEGLSVFNLEGLCDPRDSGIGSGSRALPGST